MTYTFNTKKINIPDSTIEVYMKNLDVSRDEAIQIYLEDEGYLENEEQEQLEKKAKDNRITATIHQASAIDKVARAKQKTQKERCKRENPTKEMVITEIAKILPAFATNIQIVNTGKLISFSIAGNDFELDLKQKRKAKAK